MNTIRKIGWRNCEFRKSEASRNQDPNADCLQFSSDEKSQGEVKEGWVEIVKRTRERRRRDRLSETIKRKMPKKVWE